MDKMSYPGGKAGSGVAHQIINCMPPHDKYVELFGGAAALLRAKRTAAINFYVEIDRAVCDQFIRWRDAAGVSVEIQHGNAIQWLEELMSNKLDEGNGMLIYLDPPYLPSTLSRPANSTRNGQRYEYKFGTEAHEKLLSLIIKLKCYVMISGYRSTMYDRVLSESAGWFRKDFQAQTRGGVKTESLWMNYDWRELKELHDYRFLGETFREREVWKKRRQTIERKFNKLSTLEKRAMLDHLQKCSPNSLESKHPQGFNIRNRANGEL